MKRSIVTNFDTPIAEPRNKNEAEEWQKANRDWWETNPMRYDWQKQVAEEEYSPKFFDEIDRRFFEASYDFLPYCEKPFEPLIPYVQLPEWDCLEIGVGCGSHAECLARYAKSFTGIDLTEQAIEYSKKRLDVRGLEGNLIQMDAEALTFDDETFDFIWSWGVIHHSSNTTNTLREMARVLRPGGRVRVMVYHRNWWNFYFRGGFVYGILQGGFRRNGWSLHNVMQETTDGALARYYTESEWRKITQDFFEILATSVYGTKSEIIPLPVGSLKNFVSKIFPKSLSQFLNSNCKLGTYIVFDMKKLHS